MQKVKRTNVYTYAILQLQVPTLQYMCMYNIQSAIILQSKQEYYLFAYNFTNILLINIASSIVNVSNIDMIFICKYFVNKNGIAIIRNNT